MNMISTGAFLNEMDASNKQHTAAEKFAAVWEKKNAKAARAGGVSLMALSLAACGSSSTTTTTTTTTTDTTTTTTPTVTAVSLAMTAGADALTGTSANDTFTAAYVNSAATWAATDTVDGGAGTDTFTARIAAGLTPAKGAISNVENISIESVAGGTVAFSSGDDVYISGYTNVTNYASAGNVVFSTLTELAEITINGTGTNNTTVTFKDSVLAGSADTFTLNLVGVGAGDITIGSASDADGDYETLVVNSSGVATDLGAGTIAIGADASTVTVNASAKMDFGSTALFGKATSIDASGSSAGVELVLAADGVTGATTAKTLTGGAGADVFDVDALVESTVGVVTVNGGAGNDTIDMGDFADTTMVINGGAGTDTLRIHTAALTASETTTITNIERLHIETAVTQDLTVFTGTTISHVRADQAVVITNAESTFTTLELDTAVTGTTSVARRVDGSSDTLAIVSKANASLATLGAADEETITIDSSDGTITFTTGITSTDLTSLTVTGDNAVDMSVASGAKLATINVSGLDAAFELDNSAATVAVTFTGNSGSNAGISTITTGSGGDTITGGKLADVISAGAGNDTIAGGDGADNITLGSGSDTVTFAATAAANDMDTINGFGTGATTAGGDVLDFDAFITGGVDQHGGATTAITVYTTASNDDNNITGKLAIFEAAAGAVNVVAAEAALILEINGAGDAFSIDNNGKAIVLYGDNGQNDAYAFYIDDSLDGTAGTIGAADVVAVADLLTVNLDNLITTNFDVA